MVYQLVRTVDEQIAKVKANSTQRAVMSLLAMMRTRQTFVRAFATATVRKIRIKLAIELAFF
jgi:hypothetical protein